MRRAPLLLLTGFLLLVQLSPPAGTAPPPRVIEVFDATPLLKFDAQKLEERRAFWDQLHALSALQGLVNRDAPRLYVFLVGQGGRIDHYWLDLLRKRGQWLHESAVRERHDLIELVKRHRDVIKGVVVWDERVPATALVASTVAGVEDLLPVRFDPSPGSLYDRLVQQSSGPRLPVKLRLLKDDGSPMFTGERTGSAKCDATLWAVDRYLKTGRCDPTLLAYYPDAWWLEGKAKAAPVNTLLSNHDYYIARRGFFFDLGPWDDEAPNDDPRQKPGTDAGTLRAMLGAAHAAAKGRPIHVGGFTPWDQKYTNFTGGKHEGVPTEWRYADILSCFGAFMDADAPGLHAMANASVFSHAPLADRYPQRNLPTEATLRGRGYLEADGKVVAHQYAAFYVGDYDAAAWLYQRMPEIWDDPARGEIPLGWAFNPSLARRFPVGLIHARATATPNDFFIAGDSGYGYLNPGHLVPPRRWSNLPSDLAAWERLCAEGYRRWDLRITGFVIDGDGPAMSSEVRSAYARFSKSGVVGQKLPPKSLADGVPFLRMGPDLANPVEGVRQVADSFPTDQPGPQFGIFRTILWSPTSHKQLIDAVRKVRPDIVFVDPYTLFELLRRDLATKR
ncbi:GxGYxYP domain-containing protein [Aquisphaera insulae]|uniref:GxGYxYP domain-containing protein n=1 Tax=Aquisphaera insulae TaxID=2712864 RepID=UPI0013E9DE42|nr:GxGYxYP domain-containing protein [Aquisphaera insulae]